MAGDKEDYSSKKDANNKNAEMILCSFCPSKILLCQTATFVNKEFQLPLIHSKSDNADENSEKLTDYWLVEDINSFENIGVSHTVGAVKYLACADCERGPVGYLDLKTYKSYIALSRVKYDKPSL